MEWITKKMVEAIAYQSASFIDSSGKTIKYTLNADDLYDQINGYIEDLIGSPDGYVDQYGNFEFAMKQWMVEEPGTNWVPVYAVSSPQPTIQDQTNESP